MIGSGRNLLVIFNTGLVDEKAIQQQVDCLNHILLHTESPEQFSIAHELVDRNRISYNRKKIIRESRYFRLRPFRFLINKN